MSNKKIYNFMLKIVVLNNYNFFNVVWLWVLVFLFGEMLFYTIEKLIGVPAEVRFYDLIWLLFIYFALAVNAMVLISAIINRTEEGVEK